MSLLRKVAIVGALAPLFWTQPSFAQSQAGSTLDTGSLIRRARPASVDSSAAAREASRQFAVCSVALKPESAARLMAMPMTAPEWPRLMNRLATDDCIAKGELSLPVVLFRSSLYEAFYAKEFRDTPAGDLKAAAPIDYTAGYSSPLPDEASNIIALAQMGDCVARAETAASHRLLISNPGTTSEAEAFSAIIPRLSGCVPEGQTVRFSKPVVKGAVAEALYRLRKSLTAGQEQRAGTK